MRSTLLCFVLNVFIIILPTQYQSMCENIKCTAWQRQSAIEVEANNNNSNNKGGLDSHSAIAKNGFHMPFMDAQMPVPCGVISP